MVTLLLQTFVICVTERF